jgi:hypothetical protein
MLVLMLVGLLLLNVQLLLDICLQALKLLLFSYAGRRDLSP